MKPFEKYFPILQKALENYEKNHPHWHTEVFVSIIKRGLKRLKFYIEDAPSSKITWENPILELHHPIGWNWKKRERDGAIAPGGHIFGKITPRNTATKELVNKTLFQIMDNQINATVLANATNWAWYEKVKNRYTPVLPVQLMAGLYTIADKQKRRQRFDELMRPFSIGVTRVDINQAKPKPRMRVHRRTRKQNPETYSQDIQYVRIQGKVNGRSFDACLAFEIHPLIADYNKKKAYHPIVVGLNFATRMVAGKIVEESPADWPRNEREEFWQGLFEEIGKMTEMLIPKAEKNESIILPVTSKLKIPAECWKPEHRSATLKLLADVQGQVGEIMEFAVGQPDEAHGLSAQMACKICGWIHDAAFTQIKTGNRKINLVGGVLSEIVAAVHHAHENGQKGLSTKGDELKKICRGYKNPCKAFDDKNHREDYKALFYTRTKGFISLLGALGIVTE